MSARGNSYDIIIYYGVQLYYPSFRSETHSSASGRNVEGFAPGQELQVMCQKTCKLRTTSIAKDGLR